MKLLPINWIVSNAGTIYQIFSFFYIHSDTFNCPFMNAFSPIIILRRLGFSTTVKLQLGHDFEPIETDCKDGIP